MIVSRIRESLHNASASIRQSNRFTALSVPAATS